MIANSRCISCALEKQERKIRHHKDEAKKKEYLHEVLGILHQYGLKESTPIIGKRIQDVYDTYYEETVDYPGLKYRYNQYMLEKESNIWEKIRQAKDSVEACVKYVCAGNYIDFGAMDELDDGLLNQLLDKTKQETVSEDELNFFKRDLEQSKTLLYITDNCGEIVMDKIFIQVLKEEYPNLDITVMVRGGLALNDATLEDAREVGLTDVARVISSGCAMAGTSVTALSEEAKNYLEGSDVVISKGQGNFESLYQEGINPYFFFLCKCELFTQRFGIPLFESVFSKEERMDVVE